MESLVLTSEQAAAVRKGKNPRFSLDPVERLDGKFEVPADVLTDKNHAHHWPLLRECPPVDDDVTKKRWYAEWTADEAARVQAASIKR